MSNLEPGVVAGDATETLAGGTAVVATTPVWELLSGREVVLGGPRGLPVLRTLPNKDRRMVGAWCFVDHYRTAPDSSAAQDGAATPVDAAAVDQRPTMKVAPHPHTGLQTVTWLVDGEVRHRDTLGSDQLIRPGQLNLMTAGRGIAHAEDSIGRPGAPLHGVQLWVALPDESRQVPPDFAHHANLPLRTEDGVELRVIMGELDGATSPARTYSDLVGAEVALRPSASTRLQLRPDFEYAALALVGSVRVGSVRVGEVALDPGPLLYLGCGREELSLTGLAGEQPAGGRAGAATAGWSRLLLLGGVPFDEQIVMWWNFIGRSHEEIVEFRRLWQDGTAFGEVAGYDAPPLPAPELPNTRLRPRGRTR